MAIVATPVFEFPSYAYQRGTSLFNTGFLNGSTLRVAQLVWVQEACTIDKILFRSGTVTVGDTVRVSLQNVDPATGNPDGTVDQYRTISVSASNTLYETGSVTDDGTDGGNKRSVAIGDVFFIVFDYSSYTAGNLALTAYSNQGEGVSYNNYYAFYNGSAWSKSANYLSVGIRNTSAAIVPQQGTGVYSNAGALSYHVNSTPDEYATKIIMPFTARACGAWAYTDIDTDTDFVLYDTDGTTVLASTTFDSDVRSNVNAATARVLFSVHPTLNAGSTYYLAQKPTTTTTIGPRYADFPSADARLTSLYGAFTSTSRTNGGAWTDSATRILSSGLLLNGLDVSSGGSKPFNPFKQSVIG